MILPRLGYNVSLSNGPRKTQKSATNDLFRSRLDHIIDMKHKLVRLADEIDWDWLDDEIADRFCADGRPGTETRFMIGVLLLKHTYGLSDEGMAISSDRIRVKYKDRLVD